MHKGKALLGYLLETEAIGMLANGIAKPDLAILKQKWLNLVARTNQRSYSTQFTPDIKDIIFSDQTAVDTILNKISIRLQKSPTFGNLFKFKLIEIDKIVFSQKFVNTDMASKLVQNVKDKNDILGAVRVAFNSEMKEEPNVLPPDQTGAINISSKNPNLNFVGIGKNSLSLGDENDNCTGITLNFIITPSYINVLHYKDRYILKDGHHRVYGLKTKGFTHTPCILVESDDEKLLPKSEVLLPNEIVLSSNPPLTRDYNEVSEDIQLAASATLIKVKMERTGLLIE